jgi:hypothetical protein
MLLERMKLASHDSIGLDSVFFHEEGAHVFDEAAREESRLVACAAVIIVDKARRRPWRGQAVAWIANWARHSSRTAATCVLAFPWPFRVIFADPTRAVALERRRATGNLGLGKEAPTEGES